MTTARQIVEAVTRLPARERQRVVVLLRRALEKRAAPKGLVRTSRGKTRTPSLSPLLEMAGSAHAEHRDVSSDKYRHLPGCVDRR